MKMIEGALESLSQVGFSVPRVLDYVQPLKNAFRNTKYPLFFRLGVV